MDDYLTELGRKVKAARLARGWSKEQAAREARISSITWKRLEDGLSVQDAKRAAALGTLNLDSKGDPVLAHDEYASDIAYVLRSNLPDDVKTRVLERLSGVESSRPRP